VTGVKRLSLTCLSSGIYKAVPEGRVLFERYGPAHDPQARARWLHQASASHPAPSSSP